MCFFCAFSCPGVTKYPIYKMQLYQVSLRQFNKGRAREERYTPSSLIRSTNSLVLHQFLVVESWYFVWCHPPLTSPGIWALVLIFGVQCAVLMRCQVLTDWVVTKMMWCPYVHPARRFWCWCQFVHVVLFLQSWIYCQFQWLQGERKGLWCFVKLLWPNRCALI